MKLLLAIDPGLINIGITLGQYTDSGELYILSADRVAYKNDRYFVDYLQSTIRVYSGSPSELNMIFERQPRNSSIVNNMRFVQGYFTALGATIIIRQSITYKMHIISYADRKRVSLELAIARLNDNSIPLYGKDIIRDKMLDDHRKHDIADSFNLLYNEWINIISPVRSRQPNKK